MSNKQLVLDAIMNKETERTPWVPFIGCQAATLLNITAEEYLKSKDNITRGVCAAFEKYRPDGLPVLFDLQLEAEAMGCALKYANMNPPSVTSHPLEEGKKIADLNVPSLGDGRYQLVFDATREIVGKIGDKIALYGLVTGPFTLALHLAGTDIFYMMADEPEQVMELMAFCEKVCKATASMYMDAGVDIIALVDPMTSQISPADFRTFVSSHATNIFDYVRSRGILSSFFVCGDARKNIENMCLCRPDNISIDENIPLDYVKEMGIKYGVSVGGNIKLTLTMLFGTPADNINDAKNCMAIGGTKGYILSPGCDMPFAVPHENILAISALIHGEILEFMSSGSVLDGIIYELPDYKNEKQVIVDVITLDSASCAPCQYMMEAVIQACSPFGDKVKYLEHKIKEKESVVCMIKLEVSNIPTIVIDGVIKYVSIIPEVDSLKKDIQAAVEVKWL